MPVHPAFRNITGFKLMHMPVLGQATRGRRPMAARSERLFLKSKASSQSLVQVCDLQNTLSTQPFIFTLLPLMVPEPL